MFSSRGSNSQETLTYAIVHLIAVFFQVILDAALEEVQLGLQLLGEAKHAVLTPGQVGVVAQETQPEGGRKGRLRVGRKKKTPLQHRPGLIPQTQSLWGGWCPHEAI